METAALAQESALDLRLVLLREHGDAVHLHRAHWQLRRHLDGLALALVLRRDQVLRLHEESVTTGL